MAPAIESASPLPDDVRGAIERAAVSRVKWVHRDCVRANDYNPNCVAPPELELLVLSILEDGFTQPLVVLRDGSGYLLIDGFHRWLVSDDARIRERYGGFVPAAEIEANPVHRMMSTIRHNRARGTHAVLPMAGIVRTIIEAGVPVPEIERGLGMEPEEVDRLADRSGMPERVGKRLAKAEFGRAWIPS
ncbi:ParB-like chromosome segregation protein Spo0J [Paraburkholderia sp. HC6.4b]|uniref:IbrB-like domain-containing protein n=1 Tax=unclassified Paraburkholderia TaxID=2615204 RepID=UPI00160A94F2|nr:MULTISPECIES: ParB/RepB/Spo0J family partition protein [unclassified Paraburkholderia]MBB5411681.1 ParB-like chromosome segregation protein Spo0J [Paraburkholderia sp. HC6.4b]MBB5453290.1 ParB-like chromosome segregation protein Spo0J [Paraburkholderia sp. Kb1A]